MLEDDPLPESETDNAVHGTNKHDLESVHERAMQRFDAVAMPQQELRAQSLEDRRFVTIPGAMWEGWLQIENAPRPEIDKVTPSLEKIETDFRENRLTVDFLPAGETGDDETASTLDGMHRADSYHFKAQQARDNGFQEAIRGGFGAYRLTVDKADPDDPDSDDLRVNPGMTIVDADQSVYFYGGILYDKSDAEAAFVVTADLRAIAEDKWGAENMSPFPVLQWRWQWDWYTPDVVKIAEYYEVEHVSDKLLTFTQDISGETQRYFDSEIDKPAIRDLKAQGWKLKSKPVNRKRIHKYIMNGTKVLKDCGFVAGPNIPIVPIYGRRDFVDNMERWRGHVSKRKDRQRIYNSSVGKVVETDSLAPREVPIVAPEQMNTTIAEQWARQNIDRLPYLHLIPLLDPVTGGIASLGPIGKIEPPQVQPATAALLQIASADLTDDNDNTEQVKSNVSADAMDIAASRVDAKSGIYLDNMRQSIAREGEIYLGMAREIYYEPGRRVATMTVDGKDGTAEIAQPHMNDNGVYRIRNDLSQGAYKVVASVQESTATKRQKTVRQSLELATVAGTIGDQELGQAALLTAVANMDGEGQEDMSVYARNKLIALGVVKPTAEEQQQIDKAKQDQGQQQPSAPEQALLAAAGKDQSAAELNKAKAVQTLADAHLKGAQAEALGGPDSALEAPSGLQKPPETPVEAISKLASADLNTAKAAHLRHGMAVSEHDAHVKRIATGRDIALRERQQDHVESQPREAA